MVLEAAPWRLGSGEDCGGKRAESGERVLRGPLGGVQVFFWMELFLRTVRTGTWLRGRAWGLQTYSAILVRNGESALNVCEMFVKCLRKWRVLREKRYGKC